MSEVHRIREGHEGAKHAYLAAGAEFFHDDHRAARDCHAAIELLATALPASGVAAMSQLLDQVRGWAGASVQKTNRSISRTPWRLWGYRWNEDSKSIHEPGTSTSMMRLGRPSWPTCAMALSWTTTFFKWQTASTKGLPLRYRRLARSLDHHQLGVR